VICLCEFPSRNVTIEVYSILRSPGKGIPYHLSPAKVQRQEVSKSTEAAASIHPIPYKSFTVLETKSKHQPLTIIDIDTASSKKQ
jgi:hypothetical protein